MVQALAVAVVVLSWGLDQGRAQTGPNPAVDYTKPNFTNSPILRKFVDRLPGLTAAGANGLGQYIPVAVPDTATYSGSDYYEIELVEYAERMHSDLPTTGTKLRGYRQTNTTDPTVSVPHYLGPLILAQRDRPVRIKFTNKLPTGAAGDLFIPVDTTIMGAGMGPNGMDMYTQNRATLHLHGGNTPWISDGTPHQWTVPAGEVTPYPKGVSTQSVPDMPLPPNGSMTFYYTNQQSGRLMFYHDHAYGITRLNVYAGEAAGYLLLDKAGTGEWTLPIPADQIPLVIQDKTFVPDATELAATDPLWDTAKWGGLGNLWFPHVYVPNQDPWAPDLSGANPFGRWDYGPWFWPVFPAPDALPALSAVPEAFMDTPVVNGAAYPYMEVQPKAYRLRILNACNDRFLNLQLYQADPAVVTADGRTNTEVKMVPAILGPVWPPTWGTPDARPEGWPDPALRGPAMIQIGTEGGLLPAPALLVNTPIDYDYDRRSITVLNVLEHTLFLGPAERADVIVDFTPYAGRTLILYNDSPAPVPAVDPRVDYYTGGPDWTANGGAPSTLPGFGPNTRTIMQIRVAGTPSATPPPNDYYNPATLTALETALPAAYAATQDRPVVGEPVYNAAFNPAVPWVDTYARIFTGTLLDPLFSFTDGNGAAQALPVLNKAIQELFDSHGRMNATLGVELPATSALVQTTIPLGYIDPPTELLQDGQVQIWKITHNGVDTHAIHFHLFNAQLINRVGWDGMIKPPDANEVGWKDTIRMNPLEDIIVAVRPQSQALPFGIPESIRPLDVTMPLGSTTGFTGVDPATGNPMTVTNQLVNFGWEYVWHCHLLGHEENDMMRPMPLTVATVVPPAPALSASSGAAQVNLVWTDPTPASSPTTLGNPANEIGFWIQRAPIGSNGKPGTYAAIASALANATTYTDAAVVSGSKYSYRVVAFNAAGSSTSNAVAITVSAAAPPAAPANLTAVAGGNPTTVKLSWTDNAANETGFSIQRATNNSFSQGLATFTVGPNAAGGTTQFIDTTVAANTTYYYRVQAFNANGNSAWSNTAAVTTPALPLPAPPTSLTASAAAGSPNPTVTLAWIDNASNETGFTLQRALNATFSQNLTTFTVGANAAGGATQFVDTTAAANTTYYYRVCAFNANGSSAWSNSATAITPALPPPAAPTSLSATAAVGNPNPPVTLSWFDNANNETGFTLQRATNNTFSQALTTFTVGANAAGGATQFVDTSAAANTTYYYRVCAFNANGSSAWSNTATVTTPAAPLPAAPTNLTATASRVGKGPNDRVTLSWFDNANNETGFTIQQSTNSTFTANVTSSTVGTNVTTFQTGNVPRNATYWFRVQAFNAAGSSAWSNAVSVTTP